jgi:hypothetical protein
VVSAQAPRSFGGITTWYRRTSHVALLLAPGNSESESARSGGRAGPLVFDEEIEAARGHTAKQQCGEGEGGEMKTGG